MEFRICDESQLFAVTRLPVAEGELFWRYAFICCESACEQSAGLAIELLYLPDHEQHPYPHFTGSDPHQGSPNAELPLPHLRLVLLELKTRPSPETRISNPVIPTERDSLHNNTTISKQSESI